MAADNRTSAHAWSVQEIADRLGISSAVYQRTRLGARQVARIREAGIAHLEISTIPASFDYRDRGQVREVARKCELQGIRISSFHTLLFPFASANEAERRGAVHGALSLADVALEMGASILSCHFGANDQARASIAELLLGLEGLPLLLAVENVGPVKIRDAVLLVDEFDSNRFKMLLDIGHERDDDGANPFTEPSRAREAVVRCGNRLCAVHLHAVHLHESFDLARRRDHHAPLSPRGIIQWGQVFAGLRDVGYQGALLFEDGRGEDPEAWVRAVGEFPAEFVRRYGDAL